MADVRSLLRNERATRKINHPHALYSATGTLECSVCRIPVKSDLEVWNKHLKSSQHAMRAERARVSSGRPAVSSADDQGDGKLLQIASRKRKADDDDNGDDHNDSRKKTRSSSEAATNSHDGSRLQESEVAMLDSGQNQNSSRTEGKAKSPIQNTTPPALKTVDEDEWAAFERDIARTPSLEPPSALKAEANISAAPVMAADLNADPGKDISEQKRDRRAMEEEAEKEDAARALEEEFDEMEGLEARVKRLREKREELRIKREDEREEEIANTADTNEADPRLQPPDGNESEASEDDFDEWGTWGRT